MERLVRFVLALPLAGHYGLKWPGHVTCFGQSDWSMSKTRNPSDNNTLKDIESLDHKVCKVTEINKIANANTCNTKQQQQQQKD